MQIDIKTVVICGAGTMGAGIAAAVARAGYQVILFDVQESTLDRARVLLEDIAATGLARLKLSEDEAGHLRSRIMYTSSVWDCIGELIIEAIVENLEAKKQLLVQLADINSNAAILCSNTSSISIGRLAGALINPERLAGLHFFNPAHLMKLVEIVHTPHTDPNLLDVLHHFVQRLGKTPVHSKDAPGFIVNRVARPYYLQAMKLLEQGAVDDPQVIDACMEAAGFKMGPFELMDLIGLDINFSVSRIVWEEMGRPERLRPSPLQEARVAAGMLGRKSGQGFYSYPAKAGHS